MILVITVPLTFDSSLFYCVSRVSGLLVQIDDNICKPLLKSQSNCFLFPVFPFANAILSHFYVSAVGVLEGKVFSGPAPKHASNFNVWLSRNAVLNHLWCRAIKKSSQKLQQWRLIPCLSNRCRHSEDVRSRNLSARPIDAGVWHFESQDGVATAYCSWKMCEKVRDVGSCGRRGSCWLREASDDYILEEGTTDGNCHSVLNFGESFGYFFTMHCLLWWDFWGILGSAYCGSASLSDFYIRLKSPVWRRLWNPKGMLFVPSKLHFRFISEARNNMKFGLHSCSRLQYLLKSVIFCLNTNSIPILRSYSRYRKFKGV